MLKPYDPDPSENEHDPPAPECRATVDRIQRVFDGDATPESLDADTHATACPACRERIRAARVMLAVLTAPRDPIVVPVGFADRVVMAMHKDRRVQTRRTAYRATAWVAAAAAVLIAIFALTNKQSNNTNPQPIIPPVEIAKQPDPEIAPAPREKNSTPTPGPAPAQDPRPIHIGNEFAKTTQSILETPKPLTDSVAVAPKLFEAITNSFKLPDMAPDPMDAALEPARKSLTELPVAARSGLEPVTGTAEKAFKRFLTDVGAVKPNS